ncbi:hypothetical protein DPMN_131855 [Dreissena polymorpha]|uniref:Uncharacterized protein n=1 Tax=Dreissena polymorpha TaxID=45954 RepID=A0A9D4FRE6_DREPO|nr:hypothetical protein DPMN_131855 [Dreissena polymorpha]
MSPSRTWMNKKQKLSQGGPPGKWAETSLMIRRRLLENPCMNPWPSGNQGVAKREN